VSSVTCERPGCTPYDRVLRELALRVSGVVAANELGHWPAAELAALLGCLQQQVLPQLAAHQAVTSSARVSRDHARLHAAIAVLERISEGEAGRSADQLTATARGVLVQVRRHLAAEHGLLAEANVP
jgi:hypothetical protein